MENGPDVVRLDITHADAMDDGLWNCTIEEECTVALVIHLSVVCKLFLHAYYSILLAYKSCHWYWYSYL